VVNLLTGRVAEVTPWLASHMDVNGIELTGVAGLEELGSDLEQAAAENLKRVKRPPTKEPSWTSADTEGLDRIVDFVETKTVWHPVGV